MSQETTAVSPINFLRSVQAKNPHFVKGEMNCVGEFYQCTMSAITNEKEQLLQICPLDSQWTGKSFDGLSTTTTTCNKCGIIKSTTEAFHMLSLPVQTAENSF